MNNQFTKVGQKTNTQKQKSIFDILDTLKLNELLHRISSGLLNTHINASINNKNIKVLSNIHIKHDKIKNEPNDVSIYTRFYNNNIEYAHLSIHITGTDFKSNKSGPIHLVINNKPNNLYIKIIPIDGHHKLSLKYNDKNAYNNKNIIPLLKQHPEFIKTLNIIEHYLNKSTILYLGKFLSGNPKEHKYLKIIEHIRNKNNYKVKERKYHLSKTMRIKLTNKPKIRLSKTIRNKLRSTIKKPITTGKFSALMDNENIFNNSENMYNSNFENISNIPIHKETVVAKRKEPTYFSQPSKITKQNLNENI
jgi:hypothetical protein